MPTLTWGSGVRNSEKYDVEASGITERQVPPHTLRSHARLQSARQQVRDRPRLPSEPNSCPNSNSSATASRELSEDTTADASAKAASAASRRKNRIGDNQRRRGVVGRGGQGSQSKRRQSTMAPCLLLRRQPEIAVFVVGGLEVRSVPVRWVYHA